MPFPSRLIETAQAHLEQLIAERSLEGPHLDFKRGLPPAWDNASRHELFADVSAFANAGGGDLIFGVNEDDEGIATTIVPMDLNPDETALRLADLLMNGVEPRMPGVQVHAIPVTVGESVGSVFVIRVPQSWAGPHRVKTNNKFYVREGNRKRELDIPEIRGLFLRSDGQAQKVRDFRTERLARIMTGDTPCKLVDGSVWVLHLIPTQAALGMGAIDPLPYFHSHRHIPALGVQHHVNPRVNLDGALGVRNQDDTGATHGYTQLFRNGFIEAVQVVTSRTAADPWRILHGATYEDNAAQFLTRIRVELEHSGLNSELTAMMSLLGADRVQMGFDRFAWNVNNTQGVFDRKSVVLPDVFVSAEADPHVGLKPMFDLVWQAAGMHGSINFDGNGAWTPRR